MAASVKNILIGIFVLLALAIIVFMLLFLNPSVGDNAKTLRVRFTNIDKINVGTRVTYAGKPVGEVVSITEIPDIRTEQDHPNGDIYVYELVLKVDSSVHVYNTDEISIRTSGLLGERNIDIDPIPVKPGQKLYSVEDQTLYAVPPGSIEDTLKQFGDLSAKVRIVLDDFHQAMEQIKEERLIEKLGKIAQNAADITDALNQPGKINRALNNVVTLSERAHHSWSLLDASLDNIHDLTKAARQSWKTLDYTLQNFHQLSERTNRSWASVDTTLQQFYSASKEFKLASEQFHQATSSANAFSKQVQDIIVQTAEGNGTIGRLFVSDDLYLRVKSILYKGESVFNDVKQFGLLYQYDKRWQRLQARRLKLLDKLSDPNKFACYFNQEVDKISTSLSSVSMVLNEAECYPYSLLNNPEFSHRFTDLLRRVSEMEDSLKMYNEQVVDQE